MSSDVIPVFMRTNKSSMTQRKPPGNSLSSKPAAVHCEILIILESMSKAFLGPKSILHLGIKPASPAVIARSKKIRQSLPNLFFRFSVLYSLVAANSMLPKKSTKASLTSFVWSTIFRAWLKRQHIFQPDTPCSSSIFLEFSMIWKLLRKSCFDKSAVNRNGNTSMGQCLAMVANKSKTVFDAFVHGVFRMSVAKTYKKPYTWLSAEIFRHLPRGPTVAVCNVGPVAAAHTGTCHSNFGPCWLEAGGLAAGEPAGASK